MVIIVIDWCADELMETRRAGKETHSFHSELDSLFAPAQQKKGMD